jgi:hypothetical protein
MPDGVRQPAKLEAKEKVDGVGCHDARGLCDSVPIRGAEYGTRRVTAATARRV